MNDLTVVPRRDKNEVQCAKMLLRQGLKQMMDTFKKEDSCWGKKTLLSVTSQITRDGIYRRLDTKQHIAECLVDNRGWDLVEYVLSSDVTVEFPYEYRSKQRYSTEYIKSDKAQSLRHNSILPVALSLSEIESEIYAQSLQTIVTLIEAYPRSEGGFLTRFKLKNNLHLYRISYVIDECAFLVKHPTKFMLLSRLFDE